MQDLDSFDVDEVDEEEDNESVSYLDDKISLGQISFHFDKLKLYCLQRNSKEYSQKMMFLLNELENLAFNEPKEYKQTLLNFYSM